MVNCPNATKWRRELLESCKAYLNLLDDQTPSTSISIINPPQLNNDNQPRTFGSSIIDIRQLGDNKVHIHGQIIQEWSFFLKYTFKEAVLFHLKYGDFSKIPKINIKLNMLKPTKKLTEIRENISLLAKETFSFLPYNQRINILKKLFDTSSLEENIRYELKKHVQIRNIFEHGRGRVRASDLRIIGRTNSCIELMDNEGNINNYRIDDPIILSSLEIKQLYKSISEYSKNLKKLK